MKLYGNKLSVSRIMVIFLMVTLISLNLFELIFINNTVRHIDTNNDWYSLKINGKTFSISNCIIIESDDENKHPYIFAYIDNKRVIIPCRYIQTDDMMIDIDNKIEELKKLSD